MALLILKDKLDLCISEKGFNATERTIPRLQDLSHQHAMTRLSALAVPTLRRGSE